MTRDAAEQSRRATLPADPKGYKVELPKDFKVPEGTQFQLDHNDPLWAQGQGWAHKHGLSQDAFAEAIALVAADRLASNQRFEANGKAEVEKLGPTASARYAAIKQFLTGQIGEQDANSFIGNRVWRASDVVALEKMIAKFSRGGAHQFSNGGREPPDEGRVDQATYDAMTYTEKKEYAAKFPQSH